MVETSICSREIWAGLSAAVKRWESWDVQLMRPGDLNVKIGGTKKQEQRKQDPINQLRVCSVLTNKAVIISWKLLITVQIQLWAVWPYRGRGHEKSLLYKTTPLALPSHHVVGSLKYQISHRKTSLPSLYPKQIELNRLVRRPTQRPTAIRSINTTTALSFVLINYW